MICITCCVGAREQAINTVCNVIIATTTIVWIRITLFYFDPICLLFFESRQTVRLVQIKVKYNKRSNLFGKTK